LRDFRMKKLYREMDMLSSLDMQARLQETSRTKMQSTRLIIDERKDTEYSTTTLIIYTIS
jgi:hypothetical protein